MISMRDPSFPTINFSRPSAGRPESSGSFCNKCIKALTAVIGFVVGAGVGALSVHENMLFTDWLYGGNQRSDAEIVGRYIGVATLYGLVGMGIAVNARRILLCIP